MKLLAAFAAAAVLAGGCGGVTPGQNGPPAAVKPSTAAGAPLSPVPRAAPTDIDIPHIGVHSSLKPLGLLPDHSLAVPDEHTPEQAGWFCDQPMLVITTINCRSGVLPGQVGPAVVLGHVDGDRRPGVFYRLHELVEGDVIQVTLADKTVLVFAAYRVVSVPKDAYGTPNAAGVTPSQNIYGNTRGPELRVITCGGPWKDSRTGYADNIVVYAALISVTRA